MKNQRNFRRKKLEKNYKKKIKRLKKVKDTKQHEWNFLKVERDLKKIQMQKGVG